MSYADNAQRIETNIDSFSEQLQWSACLSI